MVNKKVQFTNYYSVLGITPLATPQEIKKAFWDLARRYHPDLNHSLLAEERYKQVVDAYQVLKSPLQRNQLDGQIMTDFCQQLAGDVFHISRQDKDDDPTHFLPILMDRLITEEVSSTHEIYGVVYPRDVKYRQLIFVGPPGAGKSTIVKQMHAWPEEGNLDLSLAKWWRLATFDMRPRELHLLFPFRGHATGMAVFDPLIIDGDETCHMELSRFIAPPIKKGGFFTTNWQKRFVFDFILPDPEQIYAWRLERAKRETHPGDLDLTIEIVQKQHHYFERVARYLHMQGLSVILRKGWDQPPLRYVLPDEEDRVICEAVWSRL